MNPSDIVYVGDNPAKDFQAPQQLGMRSIYFNNSDGLYRTNGSNDIINITDVINNLAENGTYIGVSAKKK